MTEPATDGDPNSLYNLLGGLEAFRSLVDAFYRGIEHDSVLRPLYPTSLDESREWLALFLAQYWGGPPVYSDRRGHPRLRMRHMPFVIGQRERDAWLTHMHAAIDEVGIAEPARTEMRRYFDDASTFMINNRTNVEDRT